MPRPLCSTLRYARRVAGRCRNRPGTVPHPFPARRVCANFGSVSDLNTLRLRTLGTLELNGRPGAEALLTQPKRVALLVYLAVARPRGYHRRDRLAGMFWPEHDQDHARAALRKALYAIRQAVGDDVVVGRGDEEVALGDDVQCDTTEFVDAVARERFAAALEIYHGDLLTGFFADAPGFEHWAEEERNHLRDVAATCAWSLAERFSTSADLTSATRWARRAVKLAPTDERRLRKAIKLLLDAGDHAGAVQVFESFSQKLRREFDISPSAETLALVKQIRGR